MKVVLICKKPTFEVVLRALLEEHKTLNCQSGSVCASFEARASSSYGIRLRDEVRISS